MKKLIGKNILNSKDEKTYSFNFKRVFIAFIILSIIIFIIMFINGSMVDKEIR